MNNDWNYRFIKLAHEIASWSKDQSTKVGAIIIDDNRNPRSFGYNGFPRNIDDNDPQHHEKPEKYSYMEHAERNCIYNCARVGIPVENCTLFCTHCPCDDCARAIIQSGIKKVVLSTSPKKKDFEERWLEKLKIATSMMVEAGIQIEIIEYNEDDK